MEERTMTNKWMKVSSIILMSAFLAACNTVDDAAEDDTAEMVEEESSVNEEDNIEATDLENEDEQDNDEEEDASIDSSVQESVQIEGMAAHYHTGELVELTAVITEETDYNDWHWYMRSDEESEWEMISEQESNELVYEAPEESIEIRAVLYDNAHEPYAESAPIELEVDNH